MSPAEPTDMIPGQPSRPGASDDSARSVELPRAALCLTFDADAESVMLSADPANERRASLMSHQAYGPEVGIPRILAVLDRLGVRATFFVPGATADRHPDALAAILAAGAVMAAQGYECRARRRHGQRSRCHVQADYEGTGRSSVPGRLSDHPPGALAE